MQYLEMENGTRDDLLPLYEKMAKYDFTKPIKITVIIEETDNAINNYPLRNHYNTGTYENQLPNMGRTDQTTTNNFGIPNRIPYGFNVTNNSNLAIGYKNTTVTNNNLHMNNREGPHNAVYNHPRRKHYNNETYKNQQPSNVPRSHQTLINCAENANALPRGSNITNNYNNLAISRIGNKNITVTNNLPMNDQIPQWISQLLFEKDQHPSANSHINKQTSKLLYVVARHMIELLKTYTYHLGLIHRGGITYSQLMYAKQKFHEVREYYCSISFHIVSHVILPQKYNKQFTKTFMEKTKSMIYKEQLNFTDEDIRRAYNELVTWAEKKIANNKHTVDGQTYNNVERLQNPAGKELQDRQTCIFRYGRPGNEISLNVSTDILHNVNSQTQQSTINDLQSNEANETSTRNEHNVKINAAKNGIQQNEESQIRYLPLRSTSRDSGIMSPCTNQFGDQLIEEQIIQESELPYNTTSMTPMQQNATDNHTTNYCVICGVNTTEKCRGCYKKYCCSAACMTLHWSSHSTQE